MPRFLCLQRPVPNGLNEAKPASDAKAMVARFTEWFSTYQKHLVDPGGKLSEGQLVTAAPAEPPLSSIASMTGGYMIVEAESLSQAIEIAEACPGLVGASSGVEVLRIHGQGDK